MINKHIMRIELQKCNALGAIIQSVMIRRFCHVYFVVREAATLKQQEDKTVMRDHVGTAPAPAPWLP